MKTNFKLSIILLCLLQLNACSKKPVDTMIPEFTIEKPKEGDTISLAYSKEVHLHMDIKDDDEIHEISVNINDDSNKIVFSDLQSVHAPTYEYHKHFEPVGITKLTTMKLKVDVSDHTDNDTSVIVTFYVKP